MTDPILTAGRRLFSPGPPTFVLAEDGTWTESEWSRAHCCFCDQRLAAGDPIACQTHRTELDMTGFEPQRGVSA